MEDNALFFKVIYLTKHAFFSPLCWFQTRGTLRHAFICNTYLEQYKSCQCYCPQLCWRGGAYLLFHTASSSVELVADLHIYGYCISLNFCTSIAVEPHVCIFMCTVVLSALPACLYVSVCGLFLSNVNHAHTHTVIYLSLSLLSTLGEAWAQLKKSLADEAEVHLKFSSKVFHHACAWHWSHITVMRTLPVYKHLSDEMLCEVRAYVPFRKKKYIQDVCTLSRCQLEIATSLLYVRSVLFCILIWQILEISLQVIFQWSTKCWWFIYY